MRATRNAVGIVSACIACARIVCIGGVCLFSALPEGVFASPITPDPVRAHVEATETAPSSATDILARARDFLYLSNEDESFLSRAETLLSEYRRRGPDTPEVRMYEATIDALKARQAFWPGKKIRLLKAAMARMDGLVLEPGATFEMRFLRACTWDNLPGFFAESKQARPELERLAAELPAQAGHVPPYLLESWARYLEEADVLSAESAERFIRAVHGSAAGDSAGGG